MTRRRIAGGIAAMLVVFGALAGAWLWRSYVSKPQLAEHPPKPSLSTSFSPDEGTSLDLLVDSSRGPLLDGPENAPIELTPIFTSEPNLRWSTTETDWGDRIVGRGRLHDGELSYRWSLSEGDPQIQLSIRLADIPLSLLRNKDIRATIRLPPGTLEGIAPPFGDSSKFEALPAEIDAWSPFWIAWHGDDHTLTFTDWTGDGGRIRRTENQKPHALDLFLWRHRKHPALENCTQTGDDSDTDDPKLTLRASLSLVHGSVPRVVPWRLPDNQLAALTPIFDTPESHPDTVLHRASPDDPEDWRSRAETLVFGHSNPEDPRYGNGGLLGHDLGGTIVLPGSWADTEPVAAFRETTSDSTVGLAVRRDGSSGDESPLSRTTHIDDTPRCEAIIGKRPNRPHVVATNESAFREKLPSDGFSSPFGPVSTHVSAPMLDGTRAELVDSVLADPSLQSLVNQRSMTAFSTPLLGSRDPTIPAANEALLSPERDGHWTLTAPFASTLASLELFRENRPLEVTTPERVVSYWRRARKTLRRWTSDGALLIRNDRSEPLAEFSLLVDGARLEQADLEMTTEPTDRHDRPPSDETAERHSTPPALDLAHPSSQTDTARPQTLIAWTLRPETTYRLEFTGDVEKLSFPSSVRWQIRR